MDLLITILLLMVSLLISNVISHYIPSIPTALTQIVLGIIAAFIFKGISFRIESGWFLLLFVAPLLYNDGRYFPRTELWKLKGNIFGNALVLVILTAIGGGYFIHWMIPEIPLAAAFALAAILSPTDPVAVNGIAKRIHIPEGILNLVRGESLINDASGLVAFNYAVAAVVTGYFSLKSAVLNFTYVFLVGAIMGLLLGLIINFIRFKLRKQGVDDVIFHSLLQVLTPFIIFIITEELLHASGVIAVVVGGIVHSLIAERTGTIIAEEQVLTENIWSIVVFVLNGIVFLLLGLNIPLSMRETVADPNIGNGLAVAYVFAIGIAIFLIRFLWSHLFSLYEYASVNGKRLEKPSIKSSIIVSLTGVRGTVTMAGVLSIPYVMHSGDPFPQHSLLLFLAAGVILLTIIAATVFLPLLSKEKLNNNKKLDENILNKAKNKLLLVAMEKIKLEINEENEIAAYKLMNEYKIQFEHNSIEKGKDSYQQKIKDIRLLGLKAERKYINEVMEKGEIQQEFYEILEKSMNRREEALSSDMRSETKFILRRALRIWKSIKGSKNNRKNYKKRRGINRLSFKKDIHINMLRAAIESLEEYSKEHPEKSNLVYTVTLDYKALMNRIKEPDQRYNEKAEEQKEELRLKVMDVERSEINKMYEMGEVTREQSKELRRYINYIESVTLHKPSE